MKFELSHNGIVLKLLSGTKQEIEAMCKLSSAKEWIFHKKKYYEVTYQRMYQFVMSGLWKRMLQIQKITGYPVEIVGLKDTKQNIGIIDGNLTRETLEDWIQQHNFKYTPRWYQFEALYFALKYRLSRCEVATAGGKSFTIFMYCRYLIEHNYIKPGQKILLITIRRMLVTQMVNDFVEYESTDSDKLIVCDTVFSGGKKLAESNVVVGTYQTLSNLDEDYFKQFAAVVIDECHQSHIKSIKDEILPKLDPAICKYKYGLSGTQPIAGSIDDLHLEAYIGPILFKISAHELQEEDAIAQIQVNMIKLIYPEDECKVLYNSDEMKSDKIYESLPFERNFVQKHKRRNALIIKIVEKFAGNQIILVESVAYANTLQQLINEQTSKECYLIHGSIPDKKRDVIKQSFKEGDNKVLVATYETMSTGVSINNIMAIHFPDGGKSRVRMRQSCGRGLRLHPSKEYLTVFDYVDYFKKSDKEWGGPAINRLFNQGRARKKLYDSEKFPVKQLEYNI